ncbi:MAG TPA: DNA polymerase/3'-5' exonuclease PolX [Deltaproteobacteria bacterium]|nr:DNA polymerase/3'-5' exonuclease PolX [Deltaproteobacteria bacterium]
MENTEIAKIFYEIADLLEIKGENPFRVRSYRNAGLIIEGLPVSVKSIVERDERELEKIKGIGKSIREKVVEILKTGKCRFHQELLKELPSGLLEILNISGIGPRKVELLYKELGIRTVDDLEKAAKKGLLRGLPGMGEKTEKKILRSIEDYKNLKIAAQRFRLSVAYPYARGYVEYIKEMGHISQIEIAGSLRRWKDTIGDVDILVTCNKKGAAMDVMEHFVSYPDVREVLAKGETKSSVVLNVGLQVDLRVLSEDSFGAALQYFTGSKAHNIALRDRAKKLGLKISEYGVFKEKTGKKVAGRTEEEVYRAVGLVWIPPEIRENQGEIELAEKDRLPRLVEEADIKGDLHAHTTYSDGTNTIEEMADKAIEMGYEYLAITDHSKAVGIAHGLDEGRIRQQLKEIDRVNERLKEKGVKFRLLKGTEVDIRADGTLDHPPEVLQELDCVVAAIHSRFDMPQAQMTERIIKALSTGLVNILAHPTGRLIGIREPYQVDIEAIMDCAKEYGVALELNSYPERLDLNDSHLRLARKKGVLVSIGTDSHSVYHLDYITYGVHTARRGWLEAKDVLNAMPLEKLLKVLKRKG